MNDPYLYENSAVLRNLLNITDVDALDLAEAELSRAGMMMLYDTGFQDFSAEGLQTIHRELFGDIYDWAGQFRVMNIQKREELLGGRSVWYSNDEDIPRDLDKAWADIHQVAWSELNPEKFAHQLTHKFPPLWKAHPFREGNTRTIVMMMNLFTVHHGYYFDQELLASNAGYVRNAFVMASVDEYSEYEHLENILKDAISAGPIQRNDLDVEHKQAEKHQKYQTEEYKPIMHEPREDTQEMDLTF